MLTQTKVYLSPKVTQILRSFFDILMLASEFGGLIKVSSLAIFAMIIPIIEYLYFLVMIKRLYFAKTEKEGIFKPEKSSPSYYVKHRLTKYKDINNLPENLKNTGFLNDIKNHREIRISCFEKLLLFLHVNLSCFQNLSCWSKKV